MRKHFSKLLILKVALYNSVSGSNEAAVKVRTDGSGNIYTTGTSLNNIVTVRYNPGGTQQWAVVYDKVFNSVYEGPNTHTVDCATNLQVDASGTVYVAGTSYYDDNGDRIKFLVVKYNASGVKQWSYVPKSFTCANGSVIDDPFLALSSTGNVYVAASYDQDLGPNSGNHTSLVKVSAAGSLVWGTLYDAPGGVRVTARALYLDGNLYRPAGKPEQWRLPGAEVFPAHRSPGCDGRGTGCGRSRAAAGLPQSLPRTPDALLHPLRVSARRPGSVGCAWPASPAPVQRPGRNRENLRTGNGRRTTATRSLHHPAANRKLVRMP